MITLGVIVISVSTNHTFYLLLIEYLVLRLSALILWNNLLHLLYDIHVIVSEA